MASRIFIELTPRQSPTPKSLRRTKQKPSSPQKPQSRVNTSNTTRDTDQSPINSINTFQHLFEVRKVSYQMLNKRKSCKRIEKTCKSERIHSWSVKKPKVNLNKILEIDEIPQHDGRTFDCERLIWKKRKGKMMPLCIVNFNGVFGDYLRGVMRKPGKLVWAEGLKAALEIIYQKYFLVVLSWSNRNETQEILKGLEEISACFDAFYIVRHRNGRRKFMFDYELVLRDADLSDFNEVVVVAPVNLEIDEFCERADKDLATLLYEQSLSSEKRFTALGLPEIAKYSEFDPLCVLVPHLLASNDNLNLIRLARYICGFLDSGVTAVKELARADLNFTEDYEIIPRKITQLDSGVRFVIFCVKNRKFHVRTVKVTTRNSLKKLMVN